MKYKIRLFQSIVVLLSKVGSLRGLIPIWFAGSLLLIQFVFDMIKVSVPYAFERLGSQIFAAELIINQNVHAAILNVNYGFIQFVQITLSVFILYKVVRFITMIFVKVSGSQAEWGAMLMAIFMVIVIEVSTIKIIDGSFGFIPFKDGLVFLVMNIGPVIVNIF